MLDIDESLAFYADVLGFEVGDDLQLGPDFRWCTVFHPKQPEVHLHLTTPSGPLPGVGMNVDDCRATYEDLDGPGREAGLHARGLRGRRHGLRH